LQLENVDGQGQGKSLLGHSGFNHMVDRMSTSLKWIAADSALELPVDGISTVMERRFRGGRCNGKDRLDCIWLEFFEHPPFVW